MARSTFSKVDEYGFERSEIFDYKTYENFMSQYIRILAKRSKRWEELQNKFRRSSTLKRFVRKGIPSNQREAAWMALIGVQKDTQYNELRRNINDKNIIDIIEIDVPRTFPDNIYFTKNEILPKQLFNVLATFAHQNAEVGYCQGLNYIAGLLLLATKSEESSFWLLKHLVENILPPYYISSMSGLLTDLEVLDELVKIYEPEVHKHITEIGMPWAVVASKWFICLYAEVLPTETVLRIWDCIFYEGSKVIFRVGLALIKIHKDEILNTKDLSEIVNCFKNMNGHPHVINCHYFLSIVFKVPPSFPRKMLEKLRKQHSPAGNSR